VTDKAALAALNNGYFIMAAVAAVAMMGVSMVMLPNPAANGLSSGFWYGLSGLVGIATSIAFVYITQYYTAGSWRPVQEIAEAAKTGPATNIIIGTAVGFETTALTAIAIGVALIGSFALGSQADISPAIPGFTTGIFGTAVATM